jgi:hypothetical protein
MPDPTEHDRRQDGRIDGVEDHLARTDADVDDTNARIDDVEDEVADQGARVGDLDQFIITPSEGGADPAANPASPAQRLRIFVPNPCALITMGQRAPSGKVMSEVDRGAPNYDGVGVYTNAHFFADIAKTTTLQGRGSTNVTTETNMGLGAKGDLIACSGQGMTVAGGGGITLVGGFPKVYPSNATPNGEEPQDPKWVKGIGDAAGAISTLSAGIDAAVGLILAYRAFSKKQLGVPVRNNWSTAQWLAFSGGMVDGLGAALSTFSGVGSLLGWEGLKPASNFIGGTTIYGLGGVLITTPIACDIYGLMGASMVSPLSVSISAGVEAQLVGSRGVEVSASKGTVDIHAGDEICAIAKKKVEIASRSEQLLLYGSAVKIGKHTHEKTQMTSENVTIDGEKFVEINTSHLKLNANSIDVSGKAGGATVIGGGEVLVSGDKVQLWAFGDMVMHAGRKVQLGQQDWIVKVTKDALTLGKANSALPSSPGDLKVKPVELRNADGSKRWWQDVLSDMKDARIAAVKDWNKKAIDNYDAAFADSCHIEMKKGSMILNVDGYQVSNDGKKVKIGRALEVKKA